jgi:hypothetical protein
MIGQLESHLQIAKTMVDKIGYGRRQPEILLLEAQLHFVRGEREQAGVTLAQAKTLLDKMGIRFWDFEVRRLEQEIG